MPSRVLAQLPNPHPIDPALDHHLGMLAVTDLTAKDGCAAPFHNTGMLARQTAVGLAGTVLRLLRWLALRGSPPGNRDRPVIAVPP
jgi:hypothetical protein